MWVPDLPGEGARGQVRHQQGSVHGATEDLLVRVDLNNDQPLFKDNPKLRQAVLNALDRRFMTAQHGYLAGKRTDQFIPYGMQGFKEQDLYSLKGPNYAKAKQLAQGNTRSGKAVFYAFNRAQGPGVAQSVQFNLKQIGLDVEIKLYDRVVQNTKAGTKGEPFDITHEGWHADYPDPSNFINTLLDGRRIQAENNVNESYFTGHEVQPPDGHGFRGRGPEAHRPVRDTRPRHHAQRCAGATYISGTTPASSAPNRMLRLTLRWASCSPRSARSRRR